MKGGGGSATEAILIVGIPGYSLFTPPECGSR